MLRQRIGDIRKEIESIVDSCCTASITVAGVDRLDRFLSLSSGDYVQFSKGF